MVKSVARVGSREMRPALRSTALTQRRATWPAPLGVPRRRRGASNALARWNGRLCAKVVALSALAGQPAAGIVVEVEDDRDGWFAAAGPVTTIGFAKFPDATPITDQYAELGVVFLDPDNTVVCCGTDIFPQDGAGLDGNAFIHLEFLWPQRWIAADFPGELQFELFFEGSSLYESTGLGIGGVGNFGGLLSTVAFDEVIITNRVDQVTLDDLHFGGLPVGDLDGDGTVGVADFLELLSAWGSCPPPCPAECLEDLDGDDAVGVSDMLLLLAAWGPNLGDPADLDGDGQVGVIDLLALLQAFGPCPVLFPPTCLPDLDGTCDVGVTDMLTLLLNWTA